LHFKNSNLNIKLKTTKEDGIAITVSGDNEKAKKVVSRLINEAGFEAVDAESLAQSWRQQPGTPAYCTELNVAELKEALANAVKDKAGELRDLATKFIERTTLLMHEEIVVLNRSIFPKNPKE